MTIVWQNINEVIPKDGYVLVIIKSMVFWGERSKGVWWLSPWSLGGWKATRHEKNILLFATNNFEKSQNWINKNLKYWTEMPGEFIGNFDRLIQWGKDNPDYPK